ncbi:GH39 family glycosyl hydrolase [uncultured Eubacterium sp.]|uniref:GH39 family glycosyl hydrolase n=1 Tax=uncultured Eubacterium sp. TaxID=165185 RepID=UPI0025D55CAE|nr:helix-turn-helix domain-containing protein [uncultured Eubacterium sp.]
MSELPFYQIELEDNLSCTPQCFTSFNILFLLQGTATARTNKQLIHLVPHDFIFFNSYEMHQFLTLSPDAKVLILLVTERYIQAVVPELLPLTLHTHAVTRDSEPKRYEFFCREFGKMIYHHTVHSPGSQLQALIHIGNLLSYILNHLANPASGTAGKGRDDRLFHALTYISEHYTEDLSLPDVAEQVGLHPQYFSKYFREHMGLTLTEYINQLRIVNSLPLVMNSDQSLLDIALASGFNNYKTYNTAFKKMFHLTPYAWQKKQNKIRANQQIIDESSSTFSFFRDYWSEEPVKTEIENTVEENRITLELNPQEKTAVPSRCHLPDFCYSIGRAADLLRGDIQQQIRNTVDELPIRHLRLRNVFSDDLFVYYETPDKIPVYNWQYIDMVYDFLMELHIKPYTELGFMPRMLASRQQFANWQHRPNVSFPRSLKNWSRLVENFLQHLIQRYGETEVMSWKFNMWTSADLGMKGGYWHESMENFFLFYRVTYNAVKNVRESLKFGGPDFSLPNGLNWYQAFFDYCRQYELRPDFLTVHLYAGDFDNTDQMKRNRYLSENTEPSYHGFARIYQNFFDFLELVNQDPTFRRYPIVVSDWNNTYHPKDYARDTCFMSAFIAYTAQILLGTQVKMLGFRSLCDVNEDFFPENRLFSGGPGLMDIHGMKKASYYAFAQLNQLGRQILDHGENYILAKDDTQYQLLLFHAAFPLDYDEHLPSILSYEQRYDCYGTVPNLSLCVILNLPSGQYLMRQTEVSRTSGSAYDLWLKMGSPQYDNSEIVASIKQKSSPDTYYREASVSDHLIIDVTLPVHSVILIEITEESNVLKYN